MKRSETIACGSQLHQRKVFVWRYEQPFFDASTEWEQWAQDREKCQEYENHVIRMAELAEACRE